MNIQIPGYKTLDLSFLVLDYNGTIAVDGQIPPEVREALVRLSKDLQIHVLTADTHGTARAMCQGLPLTIQTFPAGSAMDSKLAIVRSLGPERCVSIGNGRNDCLMCKESALFHLRHRSRRRLFKALKLYGPVHHIHPGCPGPSGKTKAAGGRPAGLGPRLAPARKPPKAFSAIKKCI